MIQAAHKSRSIMNFCSRITRYGLHNEGQMKYWCNSPFRVKLVYIYYHQSMAVGSLMIFDNNEIGVYVLPSYRRRGFGSKLFAKAFKKYPNIQVWKGNEIASAFYTSCGH